MAPRAMNFPETVPNCAERTTAARTMDLQVTVPNCAKRTTTARTMDLPVTLNSPDFAVHEVMHVRYEDLCSYELNREIEKDLLESESRDYDHVSKCRVPWNIQYKAFVEHLDWRDELRRRIERDYLERSVNFSSELDTLPETYSIMVNLKILLPVTHPVELQGLPNPFHDHNYTKINKEDDGKNSAMQIDEEMFRSKDEPVVEVEEIENFCKEPDPVADPVPQQPSSYWQTFKKETRRTSRRIAEIRRREQARKNSTAPQAVLKNEKAQKIRLCKNIKPRNSIESSSQSDIERYSQTVRHTCRKITKKKTPKEKIGHVEGERRRRKTLKETLSSLCELIPNGYLRYEKVSSKQTSKKQILDGAKAYFNAVLKAKKSYKSQYRKNILLKAKLKRNSSTFKNVLGKR